MEKTKLLLVMSIAATMVCQPLMAQNEAVASEQENEGVQYLIIDKTDCKTGSVEDTIEFSYVYKNVEPDKATHATQTIKHQDTTIIQIINLNTQKVIDEDVYVRDSLIYNRLYNEAGDSVQVTSYKNPSIKHYQQGRLVRQYKYKGNKRYAVLCYPEGPIMCTYTTYADIQYYTRTCLKTKPTKPIRLVSDSLLIKALTRMLVQKEESILPKDYSIEIKIDAKGYMIGWRNITSDWDNSFREFQNWVIPFVWEPANIEGLKTIGYDTISIGEKDFNNLQNRNGLTFPQLPQDGDLFYVGNIKTINSFIDNPFKLETDTAIYIWNTNLRLESKGKHYEIATVKRNGNSINFEWTNQDGKKIKEEKYAVLDSHTLLLKKEIYFDHDSFTRINQFDQKGLVSSVRIDAEGDTISIWRKINGWIDSFDKYKYTYNINPHIQFVTQTGSEKNIEYRDQTGQNIVRPSIKDPNRCYIIIPDSLKEINKVITRPNNIDVEIKQPFNDTILYVYAMIGKDGAPIGDYEMGFKNKQELMISSSELGIRNFNEQLLFEAKLKDLITQHRKQILQYVQDELSKSPIEFIPGRIDSNIVALPYVFTITLEFDSSETSTSSPTEKASSEDEPVFVLAEKMPEFPGGMQAMVKFLSENVNYPSAAQKHRFQGRTICQFVVNTDGSIVDIEVVHSSGHPLLDQEAIRVIESMPKWKPGRHDGKPVRVKFTVPINFHL